MSHPHHSQTTRFNVDEWLKSINVWDEKYDYVMHNSHWLTSKWEPDCEQCKGKKPPAPSPPPPAAPPQSIPTNNTITSTPNNSTLVTIPMTPIAPANMPRRAFVTPMTNNKLAAGTGGNETFERSTRQTAKRLANQTANQNLIDLNETFDLYRSALADTPQIGNHQTPAQKSNHQRHGEQELPPHQQQAPLIQPLQTPQHQQEPQTPQLYLQKQTQQQQQQQQPQQNNNHQQNNNQQQQQGGSSRIPKIPVRLSSAFGFGSNQ